MITVISGTDRKGSLSLHLAEHYARLFEQLSEEPVKMLALENLPADTFRVGMYETDDLSPAFVEIEETYMIPATKLFFVIPEYNGSFPGMLKYFIDACSIRSKMMIFKYKKAGMTGVTTGRSGNIRGLEHFNSILNFMNVITLPNKLPVSRFHKALNEQMEIVDPDMLKDLEAHAREFILF